jgi:glycosyltransferase involved in cell wall biosynthesis
MPAHPRMDELAAKCARFASVVRDEYLNTYDRHGRSLTTCFSYAASRRIARQWKALAPDIIHVNKQNLEDGLDLLRAASRTGIPSICTIHLTQTAGYLGARASRLRDFIARRSLARYNGVLVAVQEARRAALQELLGESAHTEAVLNGVPLVDLPDARQLRDAKRKELGLTEQDFLVLGVGRLVEQKRPFLFLETARQLHQHLPSAKFVWVGDGDLSRQWKERIALENLNGFVDSAGWQPSTLPFMLAGDLLLHVAEYEGLPLAIIEAMAAGLPCAVSRHLASEISLFDEHSVLFVEEPRALAEKLRDSDALNRVRTQARRLVEDELSIGVMTAGYERLYTGALYA